MFISYVHEDIDAAKKLYRELKSVPYIDPWLDKECLLPGLRWRPAIRKAIRESRFFICMLSKNSATRRSFFQREMKEALDILSEFPEGQIFLIPIRVEECDIPSEQLREIQYVDFFPNWNMGLQKVLNVISRPNQVTERRQVIVSPGYEYRCAIIDLDLGLTNIPQIAQRLNSIQNFFHFTCPKVSSVFDAIRAFEGKPNLYLDIVPQSFYDEKQYLNVDLVACLTKYPLAFTGENYLYFNHFSSPSSLDERFMFISTHLLYDFTRQADCTFEKGITCIIVSQLLVYFTALGYHKETKGCVMDYCENRGDMIQGLRKKRLCPECLIKVKDEKLRRSVEAILSDEIRV